ncbi:hypothetical protein [Candidatus Nucleicultrix amoebiphila]|uniref:Uncharacterized protein n=1 Tax=Candidatus Nucleicultrix amoebiphila FS5 TaxID=1414854 RepID=A0A1W6N352_9PROT|nr:hypothetical protein [Candidatus Nucleicultrix amoebiphila]ARN84304.1 hypothetical protein GQ61_01970 [Candidatus Nucleicultrix amoebiphila FS5]
MRNFILLFFTLMVASYTAPSMASDDSDDFDSAYGEGLSKKLSLAALLQQSKGRRGSVSKASTIGPMNPRELKVQLEGMTSFDDTHKEKVTAITILSSDKQEGFPETLDFSDEEEEGIKQEKAKKLEEFVAQFEGLSTGDIRGGQLWSQDWYTRNSAKAREADLLLKSGKRTSAWKYIQESAEDGYPPALLTWAMSFLEEEQDSKKALEKFTESIDALIKRESDMDDQIVDSFINNVQKILKKPTASEMLKKLLSTDVTQCAKLTKLIVKLNQDL